MTTRLPLLVSAIVAWGCLAWVVTRANAGHRTIWTPYLVAFFNWVAFGVTLRLIDSLGGGTVHPWKIYAIASAVSIVVAYLLPEGLRRIGIHLPEWVFLITMLVVVNVLLSR